MESPYIVVRFVNMITGECFNVGELICELVQDELIHCRFIANENLYQYFNGDIFGMEMLNGIVEHIAEIKSKPELLNYIEVVNSSHSSLQFLYGEDYVGYNSRS